MKTENNWEGGGYAALPFREVWLVDFEYQAPPGERPTPICLVAHELRSGRRIRLWKDDLLYRKQAPFDVSADSLFVAYFASAELGCFLALGWPKPENVLDLYAEHRCATNGISIPCGNGLIGALALRGLAHMDAGEKETMRQLILERNHWSEEERKAILDYCQTDVEALAALLPRMLLRSEIDLPRALLRGRYMGAVARMEFAGTPVDRDLHQIFVERWDSIKEKLIADVDQAYGVYDGRSFRSHRFLDYLAREGIAWPRLPSGALALDDETFKQQAQLHPHLENLRQLRDTLSKLRLNSLVLGQDGRNRSLLSPYQSKTGRNQPSNSRFIFGQSKWVRGLIKPPEGYGLAYIDFTSQEIAIAAALSGDERMMDGYATGDPYLAFAKDARLAPPDATKATHKVERDRCKQVVLGVNYGMGHHSLAAKLGITPAEASELMRLHRETYGRFWAWLEQAVDSAALTGEIRTVYGWKQRVEAEFNARALMNFPMQANGAEMMRIAAIAATEAGIEVCAPVHDAFLIAAPLDRLEEDVAHMQTLMTEAGKAVTGGLSRAHRRGGRALAGPLHGRWRTGHVGASDGRAPPRGKAGPMTIREEIGLEVPRDVDHRTGATPPSHGRDTGTSYIHSNRYSSYLCSSKHGDSDDCNVAVSIAEVEIATASSAHARARQNSRFLKGPIPLVYLQRAAELRGKALAVYICITHQCDLTGRSTVTLPKSLLAKFGVSRDAKARALRELERAGLVSVEREPGRAVRVTLRLGSPLKKEARGSADLAIQT